MAQQREVDEALSDAAAVEVLRRRHPDILPVEEMPWTCNRCGKAYRSRRPRAEAHVADNACRVPVSRRRPPRPSRPLSDTALRAGRQGIARRGTWHVNMRKFVGGDPGIRRKWPGCHKCTQRREDDACDRCFFLQWVHAAQDCPEWDRLVFGDQEHADQHVVRRRQRNWSVPSEPWVDPRGPDARPPVERAASNDAQSSAE